MLPKYLVTISGGFSNEEVTTDREWWPAKDKAEKLEKGAVGMEEIRPDLALGLF